MHEEDRIFYDIERLWKDCPVISLADVEAPAEI
jgi:ribosomal silencing factor RsfS